MQAETAPDAHFSNHAWRCMGSIYRLSHPWGIRVAQVMGSCDHIRFQARCRVRQGAHTMQDDAGCIMCMQIKLPRDIQGCIGCMAYDLTSLEASTSKHPCRLANKEQFKCFRMGKHYNKRHKHGQPMRHICAYCDFERFPIRTSLHRGQISRRWLMPPYV